MGRGGRLKHIWWKLVGLVLLELALMRLLSEPILTHSVLYYPGLAPVVLDPPLVLEVGVYGAVVAVILIPFFAWWLWRRSAPPLPSPPGP
jgi:hypothetical protein